MRRRACAPVGLLVPLVLSCGSGGNARSMPFASFRGHPARSPTAAHAVGEASDGGTEARPPLAPLSHTFPAVRIDPGQERLDLCQSWTLGSDEPVWVARVVESNSGGWHHSNWVALPEGTVNAPDGTWNCVDGGYDSMVAALFGTPFFNAATQSVGDVLEFSPGAAFRIAPRSVIVGEIHLLNSTEHPIDASLTFDVHPVRAEDVTTPLQGLDMNIWSIAAPPLRASKFAMNCAFPESKFSIHYVMPHYHGLGRRLTLDVLGGPHDGESIFDGVGYGEGVGRVLDPPFEIAGADGLRMACQYENDTARTIGWGFGAGEMCTVFGFVDGPLRFNADDVADPDRVPEERDGLLEFTNGCRVLSHW